MRKTPNLNIPSRWDDWLCKYGVVDYETNCTLFFDFINSVCLDLFYVFYLFVLSNCAAQYMIAFDRSNSEELSISSGEKRGI
jgi:hypothetical protein